MQYIWQHRLWQPLDMKTVDGMRVRIIDPGKLNTDSGPDFFNAKIKIGGQMWAGDVEIHVRASDWHRHNHHNDKAYNSVILHVVAKDDIAVKRADGNIIPQLKMDCSPDFRTRYESLVSIAGKDLPCADEISKMNPLLLHSWIDSLAYERLYRKSERIQTYLTHFSGDWESTCYVTLARALGFGINSEPFERLALSLPLKFIGKHSDSQISIEALLFGQAGFLDNIEETDTYVSLLRKEYDFLAHKFSLTRPCSLGWKMARMRPQNFPHRRIAFLAGMLFGGFKLMSEILEIRSADDLSRLFNIEFLGYWASHYNFGTPSEAPCPAALSRSSLSLLAINVAIPLMHAYSMTVDNNELATRSVSLLQELKPENNSIVSLFMSHGTQCPDAWTSQALIQLRKEYCELHKCLYCRIGHQMLSKCAK